MYFFVLGYSLLSYKMQATRGGYTRVRNNWATKQMSPPALYMSRPAPAIYLIFNVQHLIHIQSRRFVLVVPDTS